MTRCLTLLLASIPALALANEPALWGQQPALPVTMQGAPAKALESYRLPAQRFPIELGPLTRASSYTKQIARFPSPLQERWPEISGTLFLPTHMKQGEKLPAAVVVHHLGGSFEAEAVMAQHLAQNGVVAFAISLPNYGERQEPGTHQGFLNPQDPVGSFVAFRQAALDVIRASDFLRALPQVDATRVGAVGVSLGAIVTAVARGVDSRLGRTVLVIGGGDLVTLLRESAEVPRDMLERSPVPMDQLAAALQPVDPLTFAGRVNRDDVLMINARNDEVIPRASTMELWEALHEPEIVWFDCGHYGVVLHLLKVMNLALDHLSK